MSFADDRIDDADIGPYWAKHYPKIALDVGSKALVLALIYIIEDTARATATYGDWTDRVSQELRCHGPPADKFREIHSKVLVERANG